MAQRTLSRVLCTAIVLAAAGGSAVDAANPLPLPSMVPALAQSEDESDGALAEDSGDEEVSEDAVEESEPEEAVAEEEPAEEAPAEGDGPADEAVAEEEEAASEESVAATDEEHAALENEEVAEESAREPLASPAPPEPPEAPLPPPQPVPASESSGGREESEDTTVYKVVINHEEQYSIWPASRENALGWNDVGKTGSKQECLDYIKEVWTDMRPLSLRKKLEQQSRDE